MPTPPSQLERQLYPSVTARLRSDGFAVRELLQIQVGLRQTLIADHVAWRWSRSTLRVHAVECKPGSGLRQVAEALGQATAYQVGISHVSVAAEARVEQLEYLREIFGHLQLGYLQANRTKRRPATEHLPRGASPFLNAVARDQNIARVRLLHIFTQRTVGEEVTATPPGDGRPEIWAVAGASNDWQVLGQVEPGSTHTSIGLLAENRDVGEMAVRPKPKALADCLRAYAPSGELVLTRRVHPGTAPKYLESLVWRPSEPVARLAHVLRRARSWLNTPRHGPQVHLRTNLWPHSEAVAETRARKEVAEAAKALRSLQVEWAHLPSSRRRR